MPKLQILSGILEGKVFDLLDERVTVGRALDNVIRIEDGTVSSHHAMFVLEADGMKLRDLNSTNGTRVNGLRIVETMLNTGDAVRMGRLARIGLRDQELVYLHAELLRVLRVERVLGVDEGSGAAQLLHLRDHREGQRRLARGFRPIDLDHATPGQSTDAERDVEAQRSCRDHLDVLRRGRVHLHDGALAELLFDLSQSSLQKMRFFVLAPIIEIIVLPASFNALVIG